MRLTGIIRPVDKMGRVVIPKEFRRILNVENDKDSFEIFLDGDNIILRKFNPNCIFCNALTNTLDYNGQTVCKSCIEKLYSMKDDVV